jgi:hypothetical protein
MIEFLLGLFCGSLYNDEPEKPIVPPPRRPPSKVDLWIVGNIILPFLLLIMATLIIVTIGTIGWSIYTLITN